MKLADSSSKEQAESSGAASENLGDLKVVEAAATTIQATFRGYKTRKQFKTTKSGSENENSSFAETSASNVANSSTEQQPLEMSNSTSDTMPPPAGDNDDDNKTTNRENDALVVAPSPTSDDLNGGELSEEQAAVKIQTTYRGFRARKELKTVDQTTATATATASASASVTTNQTPEPQAQPSPTPQGTATTTFTSCSY